MVLNHQNLKNPKWVLFKNVKWIGDEKESDYYSKETLKNMVTSPQLLIITKLSFCHSELQKCHYGLKMLAK